MPGWAGCSTRSAPRRPDARGARGGATMLSPRAEPDPTRPLGHARIVLEGLPRPPADARFCIRREGYPSPNLGLHGWQVREERLSPAHVAVEDGRTVLVAGP